MKGRVHEVSGKLILLRAALSGELLRWTAKGNMKQTYWSEVTAIAAEPSVFLSLAFRDVAISYNKDEVNEMRRSAVTEEVTDLTAWDIFK